MEIGSILTIINFTHDENIHIRLMRLRYGIWNT